MKHSAEVFFANTIEDMMSDDETDELFSQLLSVEPPSTLVNNILATVASLPRATNGWDSKKAPVGSSSATLALLMRCF